MPPSSGIDAERRGAAIAGTIMACAGWVCEGWAMSAMWRAVEDIKGVHLGWGREASSNDGALVFTCGPFPDDPFSAWYHCVQNVAQLDGAVCFDVKSGKGPVRYNNVYMVVWPQDPHHIHIVPGPYWYEATTVWMGRTVEWPWILRQCAVKLEHLPEALRLLAAASQSTHDTLSDLAAGKPRPYRQWYKNPSNGVEFDGWSVPPPLDIGTFTNLSPRAVMPKMSEEAIRRLWDHMQVHSSVRLCENPVKPLVADFVLVHTNQQTGARQQYFIEHKSSDTGGQKLRPFMDAKFDWHILISQARPNLTDGDSHCIVFAGDKVIKPSLSDEAVATELLRALNERGDQARGVMRERWRATQRDFPDDGMVAESLDYEQIDTLETGPFDDPSTVALGEDEGGGGVSEDADGHEKGANPSRYWRAVNDHIETYARGMLNDQSWYLGQHVFLPASAANSHGTSILVQHKWSEEEKLAYETSRMLPRPNLDGKAIPFAFGRRLYRYRTGERQYLKASMRGYKCAKIQTVYLFSDSARDTAAVKQVTLHCVKPTSGHCAQCDNEHEHIQQTQGESVSQTFAAGADTHPVVLDTIGEFLGSFTLSDGKLWQRCVDLFEQDDIYTVCTLQELLQSTWKHGMRRPKAPPVPTKRWAPCNACWKARKLCDDAQGECHECRRKQRKCSRKRCCFFIDPQACEDPFCSEIHCTDEYDCLTDALRDPNGDDKKREQERAMALDYRIPVCNHCWDSGWHLLCSTADTCYMCRIYNKHGRCVRTRCQNPDSCDVMQCYYAHSAFTGDCQAYSPRRAIVYSLPKDMSGEDKMEIAKERYRKLKTISNKTRPYYYSWRRPT